MHLYLLKTKVTDVVQSIKRLCFFRAAMHLYLLKKVTDVVQFIKRLCFFSFN
jgi:hypothetical protein